MNKKKTDYAVYVNDLENFVLYDTLQDSDFEIECKKLSPPTMRFLHAILWNIATLGKVKVYVVYKDSVMVHRSLVVRGSEKFKFLKKTDIEIGPCWTHPEYRGLGLYPTVLSIIMQRELKAEGVAYMIVRNSNQKSLRGIAKVGFQSAGKYVQVDIFKRYTVQ